MSITNTILIEKIMKDFFSNTNVQLVINNILIESNSLGLCKRGDLGLDVVGEFPKSRETHHVKFYGKRRVKGLGLAGNLVVICDNVPYDVIKLTTSKHSIEEELSNHTELKVITQDVLGHYYLGTAARMSSVKD